MDYDAHVGGGGVGLAITLYSDSAWQLRAASARLPANAVQRSVSIHGVAGDLYLVPAGTRPINDVRLYVHLGDTWIVALAGSGGSPTPGGPDVNPLIDEQTFLNVLQNLRPYPQ